jgi:hypothetical protein
LGQLPRDVCLLLLDFALRRKDPVVW